MKEFEDLFGGMTDLSKSLNYQYSCRVLRDVWFRAAKGSEVTNKGQATFLKIFALKHLVTYFGFEIPKEYITSELYLVEGDGIKGIVIEVPDAKYECECNRVALILEDKETKNIIQASITQFQMNSVFVNSLKMDTKHTVKNLQR